MPGPLEEYGRKRDFERTREPAPKRRARQRPGSAFVVHRHDARRLHYDLRLEQGGVLRSWAVPRGFSYDPREKRLAVETEDHPLEYESFEGLIPKGQYGAGSMTIWDRGRWQSLSPDPAAAIRAGELKLLLFGRRLRGEWHLVRLKEEKNWLIFKSRDRYAGEHGDGVSFDLTAAREAAFPRSLKRMEIGAEAEPFSDPGWLFEMEFIGQRVFAAKQGDTVGLRGVRAELPEIRQALALLRAESALLDGVLVALDAHERPSRELLEQRLAGRADAALYLYAFDLLHFEGFDLRELPLVERKGALRAILPAGTPLCFTDHVAGSGVELAAAVAAAGLPAVVAKRTDSAYAAGPAVDWKRIPVHSSAGATPVTAALANAARQSAPEHGRVRFTNLDKVFWPAEGFTKGDLVRYYESVAPVLVPHLFDRPVHMNRFPNGIEGKSFYQRQAKEDTPPWVVTEPIASESKGEVVPHLIVTCTDTLLWMANQGSIDLHPWLSRRGSLESPDWAVLDLDPKAAPFSDVVKIARELGMLLRGFGLRPLLKTSGKTGLHVFVPLAEGYTYEQSRMFCEAVARLVVRNLPDIATVERNPGGRAGKVYVDFLQNRRSQTVVPPYSVRPVPGATVSMPLHWDELDADLTPRRFTILTAMERIEHHGDLFRAALSDRQDLLPAIAALEESLGA